MTTNWSTATPIAAAQLPPEISSYLVAHRARDVDAALAYYAPDAAVTDEGHTFNGKDAIRHWFANAASEYTYTVELTGAERVDANHYVARHHLEGNFPGGVADLHFRFTMRDGMIERLVIEP